MEDAREVAVNTIILSFGQTPVTAYILNDFLGIVSHIGLCEIVRWITLQLSGGLNKVNAAGPQLLDWWLDSSANLK